MAPVGGGVVDISSDEEDFLIRDALGSIDPAGWTADLFDVDDDATGEDFDDLVVVSEISALPVLQQTVKPDDLVVMSELSKTALQKKANADGGCDEDDDDCVVLDGDPDEAVAVADEEGSAGDGSSDELQIVAEKGPIACRDFPHSRHSCSNLPFSTTSHVKYCVMCHCFVCDTPAPCKYWGNSTSSNDHCHATDKEPKWKLMRQVFRTTQLPVSAPEKLPNELYSARHFATPQLPQSSVLHAGHSPVAIQSPLLNEGSQNQQRHHSVRVSLSVGGTVSSPRAGRGMDRYHRVEKPRNETPISQNEIRITAQGRMRNYISYGMSLLEENDHDGICIKAMGRAINKTVMVVELIKRRVGGLHQNTVTESVDITDTWEPLEEGLLPLETTRHVSMITVTLSKKPLDTSSPGYQPPIPAEEVKPAFDYDHEDSYHAGRGRGRGAGGRGRGRGMSNGPPPPA